MILASFAFAKFTPTKLDYLSVLNILFIISILKNSVNPQLSSSSQISAVNCK